MSNSAGVTVRSAEPEDADALASLMTELGYQTSASEMTSRLREIFRDVRYRTFVAVRTDRIRGMIGTFAHITYEHNDPGGRILALVVADDARGEGIGRKLIAAAEQDFRERKVTRVALDTRFEREQAHKFYEGLGYAKNGFRLVKNLGETS